MTEYTPKDADEIYRNMSAIRSKDNKTEKALRSALHRRGLRFRKYVRDLPGKPDIVFPRQRIAIFVDGDFWHGRVLREKGEDALREKLRTKNRQYWVDKLSKTVARDDRATEELLGEGWTVMRLWESEVQADIEGTAATIEQRVRQHGAG